MTVIPKGKRNKGNRVPRRAHRAAEVMADFQAERSNDEFANANTDATAVNARKNNESTNVFNPTNGLAGNPTSGPAISTFATATASPVAGPTGGQVAASSGIPSEQDAPQRKRQRTYEKTSSRRSDDGRGGYCHLLQVISRPHRNQIPNTHDLVKENVM